MGEHADQAPGEWARDGRGRAGAVDHADGLAGHEVFPRVQIDRSEHADRRRDDHSLGDEQSFSVIEQAFHAQATSASSVRSSGVATFRTGTSGTVRFANPASIVP